MRNAILILFILTSLDAQADQVSHQVEERHEITHIVQEIDYLIDRVQAMQLHYKHNHAHVKLNYSSLLEQLKITRNRTTQYLNSEIKQLNIAPPESIDTPLSFKKVN